MSNIEIPTHTLKWQVPKNGIIAHYTPGDSIQEVLCLELNQRPEQPKPTWVDYGRLYTAGIVDEGPYAPENFGGHINACDWGKTSKKHSEIFSFGFYNGCGSKQVWLPSGAGNGVTGFGFHAYRQRTDSSSYTNENCKNMCAFVRNYGARFVNRTTGEYNFWESGELATDGLPLEKYGTPRTEGNTWWLYEFYNTTSFGYAPGADWLLESIWWNISNRNIAASGNVTTKISIYDLKFYSDFGVESVDVPEGSQRIVRPAKQDWSNRNHVALGG